MSKHTPGPWTLYRSERFAEYYVNQYGGAGYVCAMPLYSHRLEQCTANAILVAAAPELLEAAIQLLRNFPTDSDLIEAGWEPLEIEQAMQAHDKARAAIRKATGEQP